MIYCKMILDSRENPYDQLKYKMTDLSLQRIWKYTASQNEGFSVQLVPSLIL